MENRILIIDDDEGLRKTLSDILRSKGFETFTAGDGAGGLSALKERDIDVALIDLRLPDISGIEALDRIKTDYPSIEAIVLTGHANLDSAIEATNKGAFSYLQKPYEIEQLLVHIKRAIERRKAGEKIARLASFPTLSPNPIVEMDGAGDISYLNPAAERLFPDLPVQCSRHEFIKGVSGLLELFLSGRQEQAVREVRVGESVYEQYISYVAEGCMIRIYGFDITERKRIERKLQQKLEEVEQLNKLMIGRELKMAEMKKELGASEK
jgi:DNA-binding response OmpR family regulator